MGISECHITERNEKAPKKVEGTFMITEVQQEDDFLDLLQAEPLSMRTSSHTIHRQRTGVYMQTWKRGII